MKNLRLLKRLLFAIVALLLSTTASFAHDFEVDGIYYSILSSNTVEVTYKGSLDSSYSNKYSGRVAIPETVTYSGTNYSVTSIGDDAFWNCRDLTSITIGNSVTSIGEFAFSDCTSLTSITIPNSVTSIGYAAFSGCSGLTKVTIPNSVTAIGYGAFSGCSGLTKVTIPNSVTAIGEYAFGDCIGLTSVTIPNSVTKIGRSTFFGCSGLTSVTIPNSVTSIGDYAFNGCSGLTSVTIGNSVTKIGNYAFDGCSYLTEVNITDLVAWCKIGFGNRSSNPLDYANHLKLNGTEITNLVIPDGITEIKSYAFLSCTGLTSVTIPNSVTRIGRSAFEDCSGLTEVNIADLSAWCKIDFGDIYANPLDYANHLKLNGTEITNLVIPDGITEIKRYAFSGCSGLTSVTIPNSVTSIGGGAFHWCSGLTEVNIADLSAWCKIDFGDIYANPLYYVNHLKLNGTEITDLIIPDGITAIKSYAFYGCSGLTSITIPNSVTEIGKSAFSGCSGLTSVTIPNSVTSIDDYAFEDCSGLKSVTIGNSVTSIGDSAFYKCTKLNQVINLSKLSLTKGSTNHGYVAYYASIIINAPNGIINGDFVWSISEEDDVNILVLYLGAASELILPDDYNGENYVIGNSAFDGCSGLKSVTIPNTVTSIGDSAFSGCSGLTELIIADGTETLSLGSSFTDCPIEQLYLGRNYSYNTTNSPFSNKTTLNNVTIGNYVTSIGNSAFYNCSDLTEVNIGNSVTSIGKYAFYNCSGLTEVTIPNSVTSIGNYAFEGCSGLTEVTIPNSVTEIKDVFGGCKKITKLVIADGTESLSLGNSFTDCPFVKIYLGRDYSYNTANSPFSNKKTLKEITIGNSITSIREKEFLNCIGLTSLTIGTGVLSIGTNAFSYYDNNNYSNLDIKKVIWLTNTPPQGYETVAGEVNYVANNRYSDLSNVTIYPYLSSLFEVDGIKYVPVSPSERTCDALDCSYETTISDTNIGKTVSFKGIEMNIKAVKPYTFYDNTNITKATIDSEFNGSIGDYAFAYCNKIDEIILPDGVTSLGGSAFEGCSSLASVEIGSGIPALNDNAFYGCTPLSKIAIPANVTSIGNNVFGNCSSLEELTITDRDTELSLGSNGSNPLFSDCPLKSVYIGGNITYPTSSDYGYSPFYRNTSLETVVITDKETEISENEFYGCTALKTVSMGDGVKTIGDWAFSGCSSLDSFSFGTGMKTIGTEAFSDCTAMTKLYSKAIVPPTCGTQALDDINKWNCELYVPQASITKYQIVDQWKEFFFIKDIESGIEDVYVEEVAVTVEDGKIVVKNVTGIVTVYNLNGIAVATEIADGNEVRFDNLHPGVYIVVVNNKSVKVVL